ncbi:MAG: type II toxin-antitoxin system HicB family antitoxin [Fimbriimonadaceae bacterium]|nr:type II toxin-antitoxin system HicB family antitoxin [Fimbriimonadaceae bacterium]
MLDEVTVVLEPAEEGGFTAFVPEVPGAVSEGETEEEAIANVLNALDELLAYRRELAAEPERDGALVRHDRRSA